jgi:S-adenosylmethionine hydrolase
MRNTTRAMSVVAVTAALTAALVAPANAQLKYANCDALHKDFKHGVAKGPKAAAAQVRQGYGRPSTTKHARDVYAANKASLDRDNDGTACEA